MAALPVVGSVEEIVEVEHVVKDRVKDLAEAPPLELVPMVVIILIVVVIVVTTLLAALGLPLPAVVVFGHTSTSIP